MSDDQGRIFVYGISEFLIILSGSQAF